MPVRGVLRVALVAAVALFCQGLASAQDKNALDKVVPDKIGRGEYLLRAGGCVACHTDTAGKGPELAGGRAFKTPFGVFYSPNITADPETGIGTWSDDDFLRALKHGRRPDGAFYYPVFPYPSYTRLRDEDALAIRAYLRSRPGVRRTNRTHELRWPFGWRWLQVGWRFLYFQPGEFRADPGRSAELNRGAYLVTALGHCGECHTPRDWLGGPRAELFLAGTANGPGGERVPNITPEKKTGIGGWSRSDIVDLLKSGTKPDYDNVQGGMKDAVEHGLKYLTNADLGAIAAYLLALRPIEHAVAKKK